MAVSGIPKSEIIWVKHTTESETYYITSKSTRESYYIYQMRNGKAVKLGQSKSPLKLEEKFIK